MSNPKPLSEIADDFARKYRERGERLRQQMIAAGRWNDDPADSTAPGICTTCYGQGLVKADLSHLSNLDEIQKDPRFGRLFPCPDCEKGRGLRVAYDKRRFRLAGLPALYQDFTFDTWMDQLSDSEKKHKYVAYYGCKVFAERDDHLVSMEAICEMAGVPYSGPTTRDKNSLVLFGALGTGKTGIAAAAMNTLLDKGVSVTYIRARDIVKEVQQAYKADSETTPIEALWRFSSATVLVIDEFNMEQITEDRKDIFESLVRHRYGNQMPTLMTTNLTQDEFYTAFGERTADVTLAMAHWILVGGRKLRRTEAPLQD